MTDDEKRKYPISFREGFTVFMCLGVSLAAIMALVIYVGFFWYLEQQRQLKGRLTNQHHRNARNYSLLSVDIKRKNARLLQHLRFG